MRAPSANRPRRRLDAIPVLDVFPAPGKLPWEITEKADAPCCIAKRDSQGRLPIGFCGDDCVRRGERDGYYLLRAVG